MSDEIKYVDFEIVIKKGDGDEYLVMAKSDRGKAQTRFANPFNEDKRKVIRATLTTAVLRSATGKRKATVRGSASPEVREMKDFGSLLFKETINGPVHDFYKKCGKQSDRVRLRLTLDQSVEDLPWEFLCFNDDFLALSPDSPIVRYIEGTEPCSLVKVEYPLRVLVVIAKPTDEVPLETDEEKNSILTALKPLADQGLVKLDFIEGPDTWEQMITALRRNRTHILHFIGHGAFDEKNGEGVLVMADADGNAMLVDSERLRYLVRGRSKLALIVLNSCLGTQGDNAQPFSSVAAGLVKAGIPAVIAMQFEISDESARVIAKTFYTSLALNMPVDAALTEARLKIFLSDKNNLEWATPILYMQVPHGQLFEFKGGAPPQTGSVPQVKKPALETNAAKHYAEGEKAMARGDWPAAVIAYRGAMDYVPNYRDAAEKLSICATRSNAANLLGNAKRFMAARDYGRALKALDGAVKLDETLDVAKLRETAECGEKYQQAIAALRRGKRNEGVDLLREVISRQPDFEDASLRLEDLAANGTGLFGQSPEPDAMVPSEEEQAGWKDRLNQLKTWLTSTPEVHYEPPPGTEPAEPADEKDVFDKGREYFYGWFPSKSATAPPPKTRQRPVPHAMPPSPPPPPVKPAQTQPPPPRVKPVQTQPAPPRVKPVQTQPAPTPERPRKTQPPPIPKTPRGSTEIPPRHVLDSRVYQSGVVPKFLADSISKYFFSQRCESQILQIGGAWVVQGRRVESRQTEDTGLAATIVMELSIPRLRVSIGGGAWIGQGGVALGADLAASLISGPIGMGNQEALINILWSIVDQFVAQTGGRPLS